MRSRVASRTPSSLTVHLQRFARSRLLRARQLQITASYTYIYSHDDHITSDALSQLHDSDSDSRLSGASSLCCVHTGTSHSWHVGKPVIGATTAKETSLMRRATKPSACNELDISSSSSISPDGRRAPLAPCHLLRRPRKLLLPNASQAVAASAGKRLANISSALANVSSTCRGSFAVAGSGFGSVVVASAGSAPPAATSAVGCSAVTSSAVGASTGGLLHHCWRLSRRLSLGRSLRVRGWLWLWLWHRLLRLLVPVPVLVLVLRCLRRSSLRCNRL